MAELETDVQHLQEELERQQVQLREADRDKSRAISELSEQNHRLLEQLNRVSDIWRRLWETYKGEQLAGGQKQYNNLLGLCGSLKNL